MPRINRRDFLQKIAAGSAGIMLGGCGGISSKAGQRNKPNLVIIFTDDQGYGDVGCYGAQGFETPNLDRMASQGVRFTDFYVAASVCSPSRAALLTGCYPQRVGLPYVLNPGSKTGISDAEVTIAQMLKQAGYATACYGKWHLGDNPRFLPTRHGFDEFFGLPYSNDMFPSAGKSYYPPLPLIEGEKAIAQNPDQNQLTTWYTQRAVSFIEKNKDKPFFLYIPHSMPHVPLHVSDKFKGKSSKGLYGDVMMEIDWSVGEILNTLRRLDIDDRTLVIFTSDNGPWLKYGDHAGSAGPLREGKATSFEGGLRVPCIMRWPGRIPEAIVCSEVATTMDILPTAAKLTGEKLPNQKIDGKDIFPLMSGRPGAKSPYKAFFYYNGWNLEAVRSGRWKLHFSHVYNSIAGENKAKEGKPGQYKRAGIRASLYDLQNDIGETTDLAEQRPDIVRKLTALADDMRQDLGDYATKVKGSGIRLPSRV